MNMGIVTYALNRSPTGIGRYTLQLIKAFEESGVDFKLLQAGGMIERKNSFPLPGSELAPSLLTLGQIEIAWLAYQQRLNLIHDPTGLMPLGLTRAKKVVTVCDAFPYVSPATSTAFERLIYRYWLPLSLPHVDAIITISQCSKQDILRYLPVKEEKVKVIPIAVDTAFHPIHYDQVAPVLAKYSIREPYILYVGSLAPRKNLCGLLQAYARLRTWSEKWKLVVVGASNFWKSAPITELVEELVLGDVVQFLGYVENGDLPALYNGANLFAFPSLYEGFGLPPLEAMACGIPVVTSKISSLPEVTGDAALLVDPNDSEAIYAAMRRVLTEKDLAIVMREKGLQQASMFTLRHMAQETITVYQNTIR